MDSQESQGLPTPQLAKRESMNIHTNHLQGPHESARLHSERVTLLGSPSCAKVVGRQALFEGFVYGKLAVPQTGAKCTQASSGDSSHVSRRVLSSAKSKFSCRIVDLAFGFLTLSIAMELLRPYDFATEHRTAPPAKTSIMNICSTWRPARSL